jgi:GNAT superfamily N-acetyltransferase
MNLQILPLIPERWLDLETLFGEHGAFGNCWCMWFRQRNKEWNASNGAERKDGLRRLTESELAPGLIAYEDRNPVGWISLGPRLDFPRLVHSRVAKPIDNQPVWVVVCFFVEKSYRRQGVTVELLKAAIEFARQKGASILEGYPVEPPEDRPDPWVYTGLASAFIKAGFVEVARHKEHRPMMRYTMETK